MSQIYHLISETILYFLQLCIKMPARNGTGCVFIFFLIISDKNINVDCMVMDINSISLNLDFLFKEHINIMILWI